MLDPFELHPEDKIKMSMPRNKKTIEVKDIKGIIEKQLEKIKKKKIPIWGYNNKSIATFFYNVITEIEKGIDLNDS